MTSHELLGTLSSYPPEKIKQQYKLLCLRVHPDKGGSKALMQLVCYAYDNIIKGKGDHLLSLASSFDIKDKTRLEKALLQLKRENDKLTKENQQLKTQNEQKNGRRNSTNSEDLRKISLLESEIALLKEERSRLIGQKESAFFEQNKLINELRKSLSEKEMLETELNQKVNYHIPPFFYKIKRQSKLILSSCLIAVIALFGLHSIHWDHVSSFFKSREDSSLTPAKIRVVHPPLTQTQQDEIKDIVDNSTQNYQQDKHEPFLQLTDNSGIWHLANYTETGLPYIAIRSENGSYIVHDCSGQFRLYLNQNHKPLRVAANLIYSHKNQYFHVYKIPYGQGSSPESWLQMRKLQINNELFTSEQFSNTREILFERCLA